LSRSGNNAEAVKSYSKAIGLSPGFVNALYNRAVSLRELGREAEALNDYRAAARLGDQGSQYYLKSKGIRW
jgi:Flp pilus assembly protein TadD